MTRTFVAAGVTLLSLLAAGSAVAQKQIVLERRDATVTLEPYAPNVVRITMSLKKDRALAPPGYGISAQPSESGWTYEHTDKVDTYRSDRMTVKMPAPHYDPKTTKYACDTCQYFFGSTPWIPLTVTGADGKPLVSLNGWSMTVPNHKDGNAEVLGDVQPSIDHDRFDARPADAVYFQVGATFHSPDDEHYYGLGQNQEGFLDHRGHTIHCWNDYNAPAAPAFAYRLWSRTRAMGFSGTIPRRPPSSPASTSRPDGPLKSATAFPSSSSPAIPPTKSMRGYRLLTGATPMLPKAAYGYIQCKQRYRTQDEVLAVAKGYRDRHLPADMIVVDWFYYTKMGQMDFDPQAWPDPAAMNRQLHDMGFQTMISVWPRFVPRIRYYDMLLKKGWFEHLADGTPTDGLPYDRAGSDIDTTNPEAAQLVLGHHSRQHPEQGIRRALGR